MWFSKNCFICFFKSIFKLNYCFAKKNCFSSDQSNCTKNFQVKFNDNCVPPISCHPFFHFLWISHSFICRWIPTKRHSIHSLFQSSLFDTHLKHHFRPNVSTMKLKITALLTLGKPHWALSSTLLFIKLITDLIKTNWC